MLLDQIEAAGTHPTFSPGLWCDCVWVRSWNDTSTWRTQSRRATGAITSRGSAAWFWICRENKSSSTTSTMLQRTSYYNISSSGYYLVQRICDRIASLWNFGISRDSRLLGAETWSRLVNWLCPAISSPMCCPSCFLQDPCAQGENGIHKRQINL